MRAKKSLGQNFLRDPKILKKIADFAHLEPGDTVVEVGPGEGTLTKILLEKAGKVIAIEKDGYLVHELRIMDHGSRLEIICGDILDSEQKVLERASAAEQSEARTSERKYFLRANLKNYVLVGNIPYYITGALFRKVFESENLPSSVTFVVQKEVADRILAKNGKESILSISVKAYGTPEYGGVIKAGSFFPKPKVDSAIISIRNISRAKFCSACSEKGLEPLLRENTAGGKQRLLKNVPSKNLSEKKFFEILHKGFAHKRKLLLKNLGVDKEIFEKCGVPEKARAENLSVEDWLCLTRHF